LAEPLAKSFVVGYPRSMVITADARCRVTLPKPAHPGDAFDLETTGPGRFLLTRLEKPARKVTLSRENGFLVATSGKRITMAETRKLMDQFP
jgi:DNA-binding IclR family transcriptional regulator